MLPVVCIPCSIDSQGLQGHTVKKKGALAMLSTPHSLGKGRNSCSKELDRPCRRQDKGSESKLSLAHGGYTVLHVEY